MDNQLAVFIDFENVAIWAQEHFFDLELDRIMEYLQSRGPVVVKRAYADWTRFPRHRDELLANSIDLVQMYSVRAGKNRADIRLALDAFEVATTRPQIGTIVVISGDSDFGALASKVREYGRYVLGIGPRDITHALLAKSCDEFVYLETLLGSEPDVPDAQALASENARQLLKTALGRYGQRGELPVLGQALKLTMLSMDPTFNEANLGFGQFRTWLEANGDMVNLFFKDLQMYVAPAEFPLPEEFTAVPKRELYPGSARVLAPQVDLATSYKRILDKLGPVQPEARRDILRDVYRELDEHPEQWTLKALASELEDRYATKGLDRSKSLVERIIELGTLQGTYVLLDPDLVDGPVRLAEDVDTQATFVRRAESSYPHEVVSSGLEVDRSELAAVLLHDRTQTDYIDELLDDLKARGLIQRVAGQYRLAGVAFNPLRADSSLMDIITDLEGVRLAEDLPENVDTAQHCARQGMATRSQDFASSAQSFLIASRLMWDAYERADPKASLEDLRWYLASYASVKAGELSQVRGDYQGAQVYYLAFFSLVQEETPLWYRIRGLVNPMLSFYWRNLAREISVDLQHTTLPSELAIQMAIHPNAEIRARWHEATERLAKINPRVLRRVAEQIRLVQGDVEQTAQVAGEIEQMLES